MPEKEHDYFITFSFKLFYDFMLYTLKIVFLTSHNCSNREYIFWLAEKMKAALF